MKIQGDLITSSLLMVCKVLIKAENEKSENVVIMVRCGLTFSSNVFSFIEKRDL